jgi:hypothetical protein
MWLCLRAVADLFVIPIIIYHGVLKCELLVIETILTAKETPFDTIRK